MPSNAEIVKNALDDFREIQRYMAVAKKENAVETYGELKEKYLYFKSINNFLGVSLTDIEKIKD